MPTPFEWFCIVSILVVTTLGGFFPLFRPRQARRADGFPRGQSFAAGVFIALSLVIMLPAGLHLLGQAFPQAHFPLASLLAVCAYCFLLGLEQAVKHLHAHRAAHTSTLTTPTIPIIMTVMIAIPSFLLGTALGISTQTSAVMILVAILAHKGTAAFALALKMVRSTLPRPLVFVVFALFALATPIGIFAGEDAHAYLTGHTMLIVKGCILSLAAGTFLYMSTLHELQHTPMIVHCRSRPGFTMMLIGFAVTVLVRILLGEAHHL